MRRAGIPISAILAMSPPVGHIATGGCVVTDMETVIAISVAASVAFAINAPLPDVAAMHDVVTDAPEMRAG